ncbi:MAG: heavy metal-binding domain-containing protein [Chthoniobacterales bacterium]
MPNKFPFQKIRLCAALSVVALSGCAVHLPPAPASDPADPHAAEAATAPLQPMLLASSRNFVSPQADNREQKAKQMDMSKMKEGAMKHDMSGMSHQGHDMSGMQMQPTPTTTSATSPAAKRPPYFTCPMHPEIHEAGPGQCPKCGMTLVKKSSAPEGAKP